jgi:TRAP-type C4-dicarboxylate transport system permease small subunit
MELTELSLVVIVFFSIGYLQSQNGHIRVDMFVNMFPIRVRNIINFILLLAAAAMLYIMFIAGIMQIQSQLVSGIKTNVLMIPLWPFVIVMTIGMILYAFSLTIQAIEALVKAVKGDKKNLIEETKEISLEA